MTDMWCTFGALAAEPALFTNLVGEFEVIEIEIIEKAAGNPPLAISFKTMGHLKKAPTEAVQEVLQAKMDASFGSSSPIVSLWTAGRLCRLRTVDTPKISGAFEQFSTCLKDSFGGAPSLDLNTTVALGACMVDGYLKEEFLEPANSTTWAKKFRMDPSSPSFPNFMKTLAHPGFQAAQNMFLSASCWDRACPERFVWYDSFKHVAN